MWHNDEMVQIFVKIADDYGYGVFQNRKKCVGLCGDLLSKYPEENNVMQMLFHAGLGEVLGDIPFVSEHDLNMAILRVEKFLEQQAINEAAKDNVIKFVIHTFVDDGVNAAANSPFKPTVSKSFQNLHFKMTIPEMTDFADRMQFSFNFMYRSAGEEVDTVLEKCVITDKVNVVHASYMDYVLLPHGKSKKTQISVEHDSRKLFMRDAKIDFTYLCSDRKRVVVSYDSNHDHTLHFKQIAVYHMSDKEYETTIGIISMLLKNSMQQESHSAKSDDSIGQAIDKPRYISSDIQEYSDALSKEILYLKLGKGKRYKIVNGTKINKDRGVFTYSFEMETELHLPDDAPVVIDTASGYRAVGTVLLCEDFQIMLLVDRDLNDHVNSAYLMVEPWKLLEALNERMTSLNPNINHLAVKLMEEGPKLATTQDISRVPKGQDTVMQQLAKDDIVTVWGPPGTGKTYTMAQIAIDYIANGKSVLIVSHSNVSVDGVVKKVIEELPGSMQSYLNEGKILRFGYVRDDELAKHPYGTSFNYALSKSPDLSRELDDLTKRREELRAKKQTKTSEYDIVEKKIKHIREEIRKEERHYVEKAQLIGTTISRATIDPMFEERQYDLVMFDEVSMAYVPQVIVAAALAKEKFMCVGDFKQLAPISQSPEARQVLQTDIFSYLQIVDGLGNMYWHPWLVMLNEQRRMHPTISEFPNKFVYKNLLLDYPSVLHERDQIVEMAPLSGDAVNLINLAGTYCASSKNSDNSRFNILGAIVSFVTALSAEKNGAESVGIITPYAAQTRLVRAMIRDYYERGTDVISCATVHQFQGSESDVVVFDAVESYPGNKVGFLMGKDLYEVTRLINVAITRAKGKLITVANAKFWENSFKGTNHIYYRLMRYIQNGHQVIEQTDKTLKPYIESVNPGKMINIFTNEVDAIAAFEQDMGRAKGKVVISIPDGELRETEKRVLDIIEEADDRGIEILMKSNHYADLPEAWKEYCWGTENAVFPLIVIDDETAWYGLPTARLAFKVDKTTSLSTVLHLLVRIKGSHTIEMIKALTELEIVVIGINKRQLTKKKGAIMAKTMTDGMKSDDVGVMSTQGLATFVEEKQFCSECKSHMMLAKNKKGTAYIRCSNKACKHMEYLSPDLINWYISNKNVMCPKHDGGEIKGILSKYGPCVKCTKGHFLKPEEI